MGASANKVTNITVSGAAPKLGAQFTVTVTGNTGTIGSGITGDSESLWMSPAVAETWPAGVFRLVGTSLTISPNGTAPAQTYTDNREIVALRHAAIIAARSAAPMALFSRFTYPAVALLAPPSGILRPR